jgi:AraC-like DNA-binding protein
MMNLDESGLKIGRGERIVLAFPDGGRAKTVLFLYNNLFRIAIGILILAIVASGIWIFVRRRARVGTAAKKPLMPAEVAEQVKNALTRLLEEERIYRDDALTLQSLAGKLGVTPHRLSWLLNEELQVTFTTFINGYRIEEVKRRLADSSLNGDSLLQIAMEAGFNSKASFNRAFKLNTGMTPSEYKRNITR